MALLDGLGATLGGIGDLFNAGASIWATNKQLELQKEAWAREDNAVQRRARDMEAAGVNPMLAVGSAASSSGPVSIPGPHVDLGNTLSGLRSGLSAREEKIKAEIAERMGTERAKADLRHAQNQAEAVSLANSLVPGQKSLLSESIRKAKADAKRSETEAEDVSRNLSIFKDMGIPSTLPPGVVGQGAGIANSLSETLEGKGLVDNLKKAGTTVVDTIKSISPFKVLTSDPRSGSRSKER